MRIVLATEYEYVIFDDTLTACKAAFTLKQKVILLREESDSFDIKSKKVGQGNLVDAINFLRESNLKLDENELGNELQSNPELIKITLGKFSFNHPRSATLEILSKVVVNFDLLNTIHMKQARSRKLKA